MAKTMMMHETNIPSSNQRSCDSRRHRTTTIARRRSRRRLVDDKALVVALYILFLTTSLLFYGCYGDNHGVDNDYAAAMKTRGSVPKRQKQQEDDDNDECTLYLAPSSIPGAGLGMYSGSRPFKRGERVGEPDLMISVHEVDWHNGNDDYYFLWDEYTWSAGKFLLSQIIRFTLSVLLQDRRSLLHL
jgi:hypothetical protein